MLFPLINDVERIRDCARWAGPTFEDEFVTKFCSPYLLGRRFYTFRQALNRYLNVCIAAIEDPALDHVSLRRCLSDEGDVELWVTYVGRDIFPVLQRYNALLHWHQVAPDQLR